MTVLSAQFDHLTGIQRAGIYNVLDELNRRYIAGELYTDDYVIHQDREITRLARKYGVKESTIRHVYIHVYHKRHPVVRA